MKTILTLISLFIFCSAFTQTKVLRETTGKLRVHEIYEFKQDTVLNEGGEFERVAYNAYIQIVFVGIDARYTYEVTKAVFNDNNKSIEYMATKPEYVNYKVVK
jgi:hypothetical protein